jgi:alcohol dehydrogenase class IV
MAEETPFVWYASGIKFGAGATREVGHDTKGLGARRVLVVADPALAEREPVQVTLQALRAVSMDNALFDGVRIEPTDNASREAVEFASDGRFDGFVAVVGGSTTATAKVANLCAADPADLLAHVN